MTQPSPGQRKQELVRELEELKAQYVGMLSLNGTQSLLLIMKLIDVLKKG